MSDAAVPASSPAEAPGRSIRARFAIATAALIVSMGVLMIAVVYLAMRYIPNYQLTGVTGSTGSGALLPSGVGTPPAEVIAAEPIDTGIVISSSSDVLHVLLVTSLIALLVLGGLGAWASWALAGKMLQPVRELAVAVDEARRGSLGHRIRRNGPDDELKRLSDAFDEMLDRLERSFAARERFAANASHEIRTPLATTKALLQVAESEDNPPQVALLLERLTQTNDRLIGTTNALLELATSGDGSQIWATADISGIVRHEVQLLNEEIDAQALRVELRLDAALIRADEELLHLLVGNLLRNAVRHNDAGGYLTVRSARLVDGRTAFTVENGGDQVADDELELLNEPFYRARGRTITKGRVSGHGLGLALVANVAETLGAQLTLEALEPGGMRVGVVFQSSNAPGERIPEATIAGEVPLPASSRRKIER